MSDREEIERFKSFLKKLFGKNYDELALYVIGIWECSIKCVRG